MLTMMPRPPAPVTGPPPSHPRARRHSSATMALARTMHDGGWTPREIASYMTTHGTPVHVGSVRQWVVPERAERRREQQRADRSADPPSARATRGRPTRQSEWGPAKAAHLLALGLELREAGVQYGAISVIFARYEGATINPTTLRLWLTANGAKRSAAKVAAATQQHEARAERAALESARP